MASERRTMDEVMYWIEWRRDNNKLSAYYYGFTSTGDPDIDLILAAVAAAGKGYHHTQDWLNDDNGPSYIEQIQEAANRAAKARKKEK